MSKETVIGNKDYWNSSWRAQRELREAYDGLMEYTNNAYITEYYSNDFLKKNKMKVAHNRFLYGWVIILLMLAVGGTVLFTLLQFDVNTIIPIVSSIITPIFIFLTGDHLIEKFENKKYANGEYNVFNFMFDERKMEPISHKIDVTLQEALDIVDELNILKEAGNKTEYMKIVKKIITPTLEAKDMEEAKSLEKANEEDIKKLERKSRNPYLNNELYFHQMDSLTVELDKFKKNNSQKYSSKLNELEERLETIKDGGDNHFNKAAIRNIRNELLEVTSNFNGVNGGGELTPQQEKEYERLLDNCSKILEKVEENKLNMTSDVAITSNIFLEEKYKL